jgi:hypothetical protein
LGPSAFLECIDFGNRLSPKLNLSLFHGVFTAAIPVATKARGELCWNAQLLASLCDLGLCFFGNLICAVVGFLPNLVVIEVIPGRHLGLEVGLEFRRSLVRRRLENPFLLPN